MKSNTNYSKRGLLTKWLMYLWDKLTDCSLSPIDDFFGGVTRLHIAYRAKVFLKIAKSVSELSGSDLTMKTETWNVICFEKAD